MDLAISGRRSRHLNVSDVITHMFLLLILFNLHLVVRFRWNLPSAGAWGLLKQKQ